MNEQVKNIISVIEGVKDVQWKHDTHESGELYFGIDRWILIVSSASAGLPVFYKESLRLKELDSERHRRRQQRSREKQKRK